MLVQKVFRRMRAMAQVKKWVSQGQIGEQQQHTAFASFSCVVEVLQEG